ncbi:hypothetical protein ABAC460_07510 [Asticcacaulis sp. AC460]|uniref:hypothetical protein n=1 Tax=Asticcacaulis sp. AC460 TaxID=1282360 RepID=UPI0003C404E1|nr:hypothetical protein [Asticcacaulis sp. AC460]ESQ91070.1 hypothetical protein ABAC460_07510 [Asticcacaulis sp. AC460]
MKFDVSPGVSRFTIENVDPHLRGELDKRIFGLAREAGEFAKANSNLFEAAILRQMAGWITEKGNISYELSPECHAMWKEALALLTRGERREWKEFQIHLSKKFNHLLNEVIAVGGGAIAAIWIIEPSCEFWDEHHKFDGVAMIVKGSWADKRGYLKPAPIGYFGDTCPPGNKFDCTCRERWVFNLRALPESALTNEGRIDLEKAQSQIAKIRG